MFIEPVFRSSDLPCEGRVSGFPSFFHSYVGSGYEDTSSFIVPCLPRCSCCLCSTSAVETVERRYHHVNTVVSVQTKKYIHTGLELIDSLLG